MKTTTDTTTDETGENERRRPRIVYAKPADPEGAYDELEDDDFESAVGKAKAYIGKAHAILDKFHGELMNAGESIPCERFVIDAYSEGAFAFWQAIQYVDLLLDYREKEWKRREAELRAELGATKMAANGGAS